MLKKISFYIRRIFEVQRERKNSTHLRLCLCQHPRLWHERYFDEVVCRQWWWRNISWDRRGERDHFYLIFLHQQLPPLHRQSFSLFLFGYVRPLPSLSIDSYRLSLDLILYYLCESLSLRTQSPQRSFPQPWKPYFYHHRRFGTLYRYDALHHRIIGYPFELCRCKVEWRTFSERCSRVSWHCKWDVKNCIDMEFHWLH